MPRIFIDIPIKLTRLQKNLSDEQKEIAVSLRRRLNQRIGIALMAWVNKNWESEGDLVGGWPPPKIRRNPLLIKTGRLKASIRRYYDEKEVRIGTSVPYGIYHMFGVPANNLPQRRFLPSRREAKTIIKKPLAWFRERVKENFRK